MKINLRFGMHRDIEVIHEESDKLDGLVIPAHILAHQAASTAVFVTSLPQHSYVIDPMTFMFQHKKVDWLNDDGDVRLSLRKMCDGYHSAILEALEAIGNHATLPSSKLPPVAEFCQCIIDFQLSVIAKESSTSKAAKYLKRYGSTLANTPRAIVPPYFCFEKYGDDWYNYSLECADSTRLACSSKPVMPVLAFNYKNIDNAVASEIANDYRNFRSVMLWPGNFVQSAVRPDDILRVRTLIKAFRDSGIAVEAMYGGYLLMLFKDDGVTDVSHGILYTEHKGFEASPGGGGVPDRYYIPTFHEFRSLSQTDLILHKHPELMCGCEICNPVLKGNPDNFIRFADSPELLRRHFLTVRRQEAQNLAESSREVISQGLLQVHRQYHSSLNSLPNPDSFVEPSRMRGLDYLASWVQGLRSAV